MLHPTLGAIAVTFAWTIFTSSMQMGLPPEMKLVLVFNRSRSTSRLTQQAALCPNTFSSPITVAGIRCRGFPGPGTIKADHAWSRTCTSKLRIQELSCHPPSTLMRHLRWTIVMFFLLNISTDDRSMYVWENLHNSWCPRATTHLLR